MKPQYSAPQVFSYLFPESDEDAFIWQKAERLP